MSGWTKGDGKLSRFRQVLFSVLLPIAGALSAPSIAAATPAPFGHACAPQDGVRFCPTASLTQRVPSFDGTPLDVDVTLPSEGEGPFPTIVMLHGWGGSKTSFEASSPEGNGNETFDYNNVYFAQHGYAVVNYSARGFGNSCGSLSSRDETPACLEGFIRLADQRYEARDTQYLLGLLADEKITKPGLIGVTGISYGGGQSIELAYLKNRIRLPDGEFAPWVSPKGKAMHIAAAYPRWPWSDLVDALEPNGRFLDTEIAPPKQSFEPLGVQIESYVERPVRGRPGERLHRPAGSRPRSRPDEMAHGHHDRRTGNARRHRNSRAALHLPPGLRPTGNARADAARERLDGRPVPGGAVAARVQPGALRERLRVAHVRRPRTQPGNEQGEQRSRVQRRGGGLLRSKARARRRSPEKRQRDRVHADVPVSRTRRRSVQRHDLGEAALRRPGDVRLG